MPLSLKSIKSVFSLPDGCELGPLCRMNVCRLLSNKVKPVLASMETEYGIEARPDHYACIVDLLGRAGLLNKVVEVIKRMHFKPHCAIFGTLLGACRTHKNSKVAEYATQNLLDLGPTSLCEVMFNLLMFTCDEQMGPKLAEFAIDEGQ
ncbi:hypothetical protein IFM89_001105 [Coptis chinensis]|uniref:Pentatricopeptide repeat-containing protein n=1 Tax=Coptis chinensis TaxID=261450 RepID=A0A835M6N5_9MAGN|nr:hypothetical protein IFM89_001105 [Coptis chinensis]